MGLRLGLIRPMVRPRRGRNPKIHDRSRRRVVCTARPALDPDTDSAAQPAPDGRRIQ